MLCDADAADYAEILAVPFRVLRDAGITVNFASPSGCIRLAPAFDAGESSSKTAPSSPSSSPSSFAVELMKRAIALDRAVLMTGISYDGVVSVGPSGPHDPSTGACAKAQQIGQLMRDLGRLVGALGSGIAMLAHLNDGPPPTDAPMLRGLRVSAYAHAPWAAIPGLGEAIVAADAVPDPAPAVRDGPVVTPASPQGEALHEAAALLRDAPLDYRSRAKQRGTPPGPPLIGDGGGCVGDSLLGTHSLMRAGV